MNEPDPFVLCVDVDGVIGDYNGFFRPFVATTLGLDESTFEEQGSWEYTATNWGIRDREHYTELHHAAVEAGMFRDMPAVDGASEALWELSDEGFHIRVVTHRLVGHWRHDRVVADTVAWLQQPSPTSPDRPLIPYRDLAFMGFKADVAGDVIVDDAPHNVEALRAARERGRPAPEPIVFDHPYNRHVEGPRALNWTDVKRLVRAKRAWTASNPLAV